MKKGFTLVELIIVVGILSIIMLVISVPVSNVIRYQRDSQTSDNMRDNLQFVINKMEKELKTASNVYVDDDGNLNFKDQFGGSVKYSLIDNEIIKNDSIKITDKNIFKVNSLNFIIKDKDNLDKLITILIKAESLLNSGDNVSMQISINPLNEKTIIKDGLLIYLDAGNSNSYISGGNYWNDLSGNSRDLILSGGVSYSKNYGGYLQFDGEDDYASLLSTGLSGNNAPHSIEMWVNIDNDINDTYRWWLLQLGNYSVGSHHWIKNQFGTWGIFPGGRQVNYDHTSSKGNWVHLVSTYDGSELSFYINESLYENKSALFNFGTGDIPLYIGKKFDNSLSIIESYFKGKISSIQIYNRAISSEEVKYNYDIMKGRFGY